MSCYGNDQVAVVQWESNPISDMYADSVIAAIMHAQSNPIPEKCKLKIHSLSELAVCRSSCRSFFPNFQRGCRRDGETCWLKSLISLSRCDIQICGDDVSIVTSERGLIAQFEEDGRRLLVEGTSDGPVTMGGDDPMDDPTTSHLLQNLTEKMRQVLTSTLLHQSHRCPIQIVTTNGADAGNDLLEMEY